mgnify:CR=1 FL=1
MTDNHLGREDAAKYLTDQNVPVTVRTLDRWRSDGVGPPYVKVGKRVAYRRASIDAWLRSHEIVPPREKKRMEAA